MNLDKNFTLYGIQFTYRDGSIDDNIYGSFEDKNDAIAFENSERRALQWDNSLKTNIVSFNMTLREIINEALSRKGIKSFKV